MDSTMRFSKLASSISRRAVTKYFAPLIDVVQPHPETSRLDRTKLVESHTSAVANSEIESYKLTATDLFVENAQEHLAARARWNYGAAIAIGLIAVAAAILTLVLLLRIAESIPLGNMQREVPTNIQSALVALVPAVLSFACFGFMAKLAYEFAKVADSVLSKRHALRLGRLYIHLKGGDVDISELMRFISPEAGPSIGETDASVAKETLDAISATIKSSSQPHRKKVA